MQVETISSMLGRTFVSIAGTIGDDECIFTDANGDGIRFYHSLDCCEDVSIEDVIGDLQDLVGDPILLAEETCRLAEPNEVSELVSIEEFSQT